MPHAQGMLVEVKDDQVPSVAVLLRPIMLGTTDKICQTKLKKRKDQRSIRADSTEASAPVTEPGR